MSLGQSVKMHCGLAGIVASMLFSVTTFASTPVVLAPSTSKESTVWQSDGFTFEVTSYCETEMSGPFVDNVCGRMFDFRSSRTIMDRRLSSIESGERTLKQSDVSFSVNEDVVLERTDRPVSSGVRVIYALLNDSANTVTIKYPAGVLRDDWHKTWKGPGEGQTTERQNKFKTASFTLKNFDESVRETDEYARKQSDREVSGINLLLLIAYSAILGVLILCYKVAKNRLIPASKERFANAKDHLRDSAYRRKVRHKAEAIKVQEEAKKLHETEKLKYSIQQALNDGDHDKAEKLLANLREIQEQ